MFYSMFGEFKELRVSSLQYAGNKQVVMKGFFNKHYQPGQIVSQVLP